MSLSRLTQLIMKKRKQKTYGEMEAELARKQIQNKRFHQKVKGSGFVYNRQKNKKINEYSKEDEGSV